MIMNYLLIIHIFITIRLKWNSSMFLVHLNLRNGNHTDFSGKKEGQKKVNQNKYNAHKQLQIIC